MSQSVRHILVLGLLVLAAPAGAVDKQLVKPADARRDALVKAGYTAIPLTVSPELRLYVEGAIGSEKVRFKLCSGESMTVIDFSVARRLGLPLGEAVPRGMGSSYAGRVAEYPGISLGTFAPLKNWNMLKGMAVDLSRLDNHPTGLLAMDVLDAWGAVVDYPGRTLYVRPMLQNAWPRLAGAWTVTNWQEDGETRKLDPKALPTLTFADRRFKLIDGGQTREYAMQMVPAEKKGLYRMVFFDPKQEDDRAPAILADSLIKVAGDRMTVCLVPDVKKAKRAPTEFAAPKGSGYVLLELKRTSQKADSKTADPLREIMVKDGFTPVPMEELNGQRIVMAKANGTAFQLLVETGESTSTFDSTALSKWGAKRIGSIGTLDGGSTGTFLLRGPTLGNYNTRQAWMVIYGMGDGPANLNQAPAAQKQSLHGQLGNTELLTGSAVIDFTTNTMYMRPIKQKVMLELEGKWVGVAWESGGNKGPYKPGDSAIEFKNGKLRFAAKDGAAEWDYHLQDLGNRYQIGLFSPGKDALAEKFKYEGTGLLKLSGDKLTVVMQRGTRDMPMTFAAPPGSGFLIVEYERSK